MYQMDVRRLKRKCTLKFTLMLQKLIIIKVDCQNKSGSQESGQKSQTLL